MRTAAFNILVVCIAACTARGDIVITLVPKDSAGHTIRGSVAPGTTVNVDILVSTPPAADPIVDVRLFQFDFGASSQTIELTSFKWDLSSVGYGFQEAPKESYPVAGAASLQFESDESLITLVHDPVKVATVGVRVKGDGTLSLQPKPDGDQRCSTRIDAGFKPRTKYEASEGKISSARYEFSTQAIEAPRRAEPMPPEKRRKCGAVAIGGCLLLFGGLSLMGLIRRVRK